MPSATNPVYLTNRTEMKPIFRVNEENNAIMYHGSWPWKNGALLVISRWQTRDTKPVLWFNKQNNKEKQIFFLFLQNDCVLRRFAVVSSNFHICSWFPSDFLISHSCHLFGDYFGGKVLRWHSTNYLFFFSLFVDNNFALFFSFCWAELKKNRASKKKLGGWMNGETMSLDYSFDEGNWHRTIDWR